MFSNPDYFVGCFSFSSSLSSFLIWQFEYSFGQCHSKWILTVLMNTPVDILE